MLKLRRAFRNISNKYMVKQISISLTMRCHLHCSYCGVLCYNGKWPVCRELSFQEWLPIFEKLNGTSEIHVTGGEPYLHKDFLDIVNHLAKNHLVFIYTSLLSTILFEIIPNENIIFIASRHLELNEIQSKAWNHNYNFIKKRFGIRVKELSYNPEPFSKQIKILKPGPETSKLCYDTIGPWMTPDGNFFLNPGQAYKYMFSKQEE